MGRVFLLLLLALNSLVAQSQQSTLNLVTLGDSLTEGVPHLNGEQDTYPFISNCAMLTNHGAGP